MKKLFIILFFILSIVLLAQVNKDEPTPQERRNQLFEIYGDKTKYFVFSDM